MDRSFSKNKLYVKVLKNERRFFISSIVNFVSLGCLDNGITKLLKADSTDDLLPNLSVAETEMVLQDINNLENRHQAFKSLVIPLSRQPSDRHSVSRFNFGLIPVPSLIYMMRCL
jgi:hypothetical protein